LEFFPFCEKLHKNDMRLFPDFLNQNIFTRSVKNIRNQMLDLHFRKQKADRMNLPADFNPKGVIVFVIAYNSHPCIEVMLKRWRALMSNTTLVVVDNSSSRSQREVIARLCIEGRFPYVGLPKNPEWSPNRSHGISMNWIYYNLVTKWQPEIFGFLDHDCFPFGVFDLVSIMRGHDLFGLKLFSPTKPSMWKLWAGFCFYRTSRVKGLKIDFKHSVEDGLDTGGKNWPGLYSQCDPSEVCVAEEKSNVICDRFFHLGSASYRHNFSTASELVDALPDFCKHPGVKRQPAGSSGTTES